MPIRPILRSLEQRCLRPLGRLLRRSTSARGGSRIERLERRIEELEGHVRELSGLAWLRLDQADDRDAAGAEPRDAANPREAA